MPRNDPRPTLAITAVRAFYAAKFHPGEDCVVLASPDFNEVHKIATRIVPSVDAGSRWHRFPDLVEVGAWAAPDGVLGLEFKMLDGAVVLSRAVPERGRADGGNRRPD